jgi:hypothetical protein
MLYEPFPSWLRDLISRLETLFEAVRQVVAMARTAIRDAYEGLRVLVRS